MEPMTGETACRTKGCEKSREKKYHAKHAKRLPIVVQSAPRARTLLPTPKLVAQLDAAALPHLFSMPSSFRASSLEQLEEKRLKNWVANYAFDQSSSRSSYLYVHARSRYHFPRAIRQLGIGKTIEQRHLSKMLDRIMGAYHQGDREIIELYRKAFLKAGLGFLVEAALEVAEYEHKERVNYA